MRKVLSEVLAANAAYASSFGGKGGLGLPRHAQYIDFLTIKDQKQSVIDDVERIRRSPLVPGDIPIYGYVYAVESGRLVEVPEATAIGRPS
jgi:carbonic anhydrase